MQASPCAPSTPLAFSAVLYPHRSLGAGGFAVLMAAIVVVSVLLGVAFALAGAWPVTGFLGLDVLLLYLAFRWCRRDARRAEVIQLDQGALTVRRIAPSGKSEKWRFEPYWVRVDIDDPPKRDSLIRLSSHGQSVALGAFLTPHERLEVADALRAALRPFKDGPAPAEAP